MCNYRAKQALVRDQDGKNFARTENSRENTYFGGQARRRRDDSAAATLGSGRGGIGIALAGLDSRERFVPLFGAQRAFMRRVALLLRGLVVDRNLGFLLRLRSNDAVGKEAAEQRRDAGRAEDH